MAVAQVRRRRTYAGEEDWFGLLDELGPRAVRRGFVRRGMSVAIAGNLVWWLDDQRALDRHFSPELGVKYRRILRDLDLEEVRAAARSTPGLFNSSSLAA